MKKEICIISIISIFFLVSCQTEEYEVITEEDQNSITLNTEAYDLVYRTAMHDGSEDDDIDNSPCLSIEFPYTVNFQGEEIVINSLPDLRSFLETIPDSHSEEIILNFPVTVINVAHQRVQVNNRQQFAGLQQACRNLINQGRAPINCVRFIFPLRVNSYNSASQQAGSTILNSHAELFRYLDNLNNNSVISFDYPLSISVSQNNQTITINNKNELRDILEECIL